MSKKISKKQRMKIITNLKDKLHNLVAIERLNATPYYGFNKSDEFLGDLIVMKAYLNNVLHKFGY
jgi:hypothetical protein